MKVKKLLVVLIKQPLEKAEGVLQRRGVIQCIYKFKLPAFQYSIEINNNENTLETFLKT